MTLPPAGPMVVAAAAAHGACHWCVDRALRRQAWYAALPAGKRLDVDVNLTWLLLGTPLPLLYLSSLSELGGTATARWLATSDRTTLTLIMHVGQSVRTLAPSSPISAFLGALPRAQLGQSPPRLGWRGHGIAPADFGVPDARPCPP